MTEKPVGVTVAAVPLLLLLLQVAAAARFENETVSQNRLDKLRFKMKGQLTHFAPVLAVLCKSTASCDNRNKHSLQHQSD